MQVLSRGFAGVGPDMVKSASAMIGTEATNSNQWPYWWLKPRSDAQAVQRFGWIPAPVAGVLTEITRATVIVPEAMVFVLRGYRLSFSTSVNPNPFVDGSGSILWTIDVDNPVGSGTNALAGYAVPDLYNIADERGSKLGPFPIEGYTVFKPKQVLRVKVITTADIPAADPNYIGGGLFGWFCKAL